MQKMKVILKRFFFISIDFILYFYCKALSKNYSYYYSLRMNYIVHLNPNWGLNLERESQLHYLKSKGMKSNHFFLDYGCGAISAGQFFINFLDSKKYIGLDISELVISEAKKRVLSFNLQNKKPQFILAKEGFFESLTYKKFDFIWAQSVLTHMPPQSVDSMFKQLKPYFAKSTCFFFTFTQNKNGIKHKQFKDWSYSFEELCKIANKYGLELFLQSDWKHTYDDTDSDKMVLAKLK